jgi:hypothetical protein
VNEVANDLDAALERLLSRLLSNSPTALRRGLYAMKAVRSMSFEEAIAFGEGQIGLLVMTQDAREGLAAFKEKRKPQWRRPNAWRSTSAIWWRRRCARPCPAPALSLFCGRIVLSSTARTFLSPISRPILPPSLPRACGQSMDRGLTR